ncbi:hypothetical protein SAMN05216569_0277 [Pseudoxanthomonas sp. CF125]|nr:hypothetical protein SAMN05216569_0277 [Pseudoxanthomonas sp. CF125]
MRESDAIESLSWIRVYAPDTFPLSQFARVVSDNEWPLFEKDLLSEVSGRPDRWASIVLGEVLAQGEPDSEIGRIPLSRGSATFSMPLARCLTLHDNEKLAVLCRERLRMAETDRRFVRRPVSTTDLEPVWALAQSSIDHALSAKDAVEVVVNSAHAYQRNVESRTGTSSPKITDYKELYGDSAEERVLAFQKLVASIEASRSTSVTTVATLAAAAFLVGRGTSHSFLLRKVPALAPRAFAWFGLIASYVGVRGWDPQWTRAAKGLEKQIRAGFDWADPPSADICWIEYSWLANKFSNAQPYAEIAQTTTRTLSIEVVPGSTCQFRLVATEPTKVPKNETNPSAARSVRETELQAILDQFMSLATKAGQILGTSTSKPASSQGSLPLSKTTPPSKPSRSKKSSPKYPDS